MSFLSSLALIALIKLALASNSTNLVQVLLIYGNVPRAPSFVYENDLYDLSYWSKYGLNEITEKGLLTSYNFGQFVKNYYTNFLSPLYNASNVYARSPDLDSSLMSTSAFLAGMYPPASANQIWSNDVTWFPIPVHTTDKNQDQIFYDNCKKYDSLLKTSLTSSDHLKTEQEYKNFTKLIEQLSGLYYLNYIDLYQILEYNKAKQANNLPLDEWVRDNFFNLTQADKYQLSLKYDTIEKSKLKSGGILNSVKEELKSKINQVSSKEIFIYSCKESHLNGLKRLLDIELPLTQLEYLSAIVIELRKDANESYYVQVLYKNNSLNESNEFNPIQLKECDTLCPWDKFISIISDKTVSNLVNECNFKESLVNSFEYDMSTVDVQTDTNATNNKNNLSSLDLALIVAVSVLGSFVIVLFILLVFTCIKVRKGVSTRI